MPIALLLITARAFAVSPDCLADPNSRACKLDHTLTLLYWIAGVLALLLTVIVVLAWFIYRKNTASKLTPND